MPERKQDIIEHGAMEKTEASDWSSHNQLIKQIIIKNNRQQVI